VDASDYAVILFSEVVDFEEYCERTRTRALP